MAYTVEPVIADGPNGEVVVDFAINPHTELHNGSVDPFNKDFVEVDGQTRHIMSDVEMSDELTQHEEEYIETLMESNPYISKAIEWQNQICLRGIRFCPIFEFYHVEKKSREI